MKEKFKMLSAMLIFGSIGLFVKHINLSSSEIAFLRGIIGSIFLLMSSFVIKQKLSVTAIKENLILLLISGAAIGVNWILLFQSYRYTTISNATLSYYFAPVFVTLLSPIILKEKLTPVKLGCIIAAMIGLFLTVGTGKSSDNSYNHLIGVLYGLSAAVLYASVVLINKFIKNLSGFETTFIQLTVAALVLLPYVLIKEQMNLSGLDLKSIILIIIVGIVHTGFAYFLYFTSFKELKGQTIAALSYIDPITAIIFSAVFLKESLSFIQVIGGVLILSSTFLSDKLDKKKEASTA